MSQPAIPTLTGLRVGAYEVQALLGAGAIGVVHQALDTRLNRRVAIKFLSDELASPAARRRFQREAQAASSLNHPHIVTVHDAGEFEGRQYLVTELVDGGTFRDWLQSPRDWRQTVELLIGVADGLAAAHDAGILHRDIKPANILVTRSGYAKLADFGLAKLHEDPAGAEASPTVTDAGTRAGTIVGTAAYMSPEQASGRTLDCRSDVFSFGVVLYEALAGERPFVGGSEVDILHAILHRSAAPLSDGLPLPLRMLVEKALDKEPAHRFQSMHDVVVDLRRLARHSAEAPAPVAVTAASGRPRRWWVAAALLVTIAAAGALWLSRFPSTVEPARLEYRPLTSFADSVTSPVLSPDGRMLAFIRGPGAWGAGPAEIYVKLLPDGEPVQLTRDNRIKSHPRFSPDGGRIAYTTTLDGTTLDTWIVPTLGGPPRPLLTNASGLTWVAEPVAAGSHAPSVLFSEFTGRGFQMSIAASTESRAGHRTVYLPTKDAGMAHRSSLSPDRTQVLIVEMDAGGWLPCRVLPFDGSTPGRPIGPSGSQCTDAAWTPDGQWMYFSASTGTGTHIWRQRFPRGLPEQVTFGVTEEEDIHVDPDGRSFVTAIGNRQSTVWIHEAGKERQITSEGFAFLPAFSPDGRTLYYLTRSGTTRRAFTGGLFAADLRSGQRQRLLPEFQMVHYDISADGQRVVFVAADEAGDTSVWLAPVNGRTAPRRIAARNSWKTYFGPSGAVVFAGEESPGSFRLYRIGEDGTGLREISPTPMLDPFAVSPDGRWVAAAEGPAPETRNALMVHPVAGGTPVLVCRCYPPPNIESGPMPAQLRWTPDASVVYLRYDTSTYAIPLPPGEMLPPIPPAGFASKEDVAAIPGARLISEESVFTGPSPSVHAFMKVSTQRNIYRVPIP